MAEGVQLTIDNPTHTPSAIQKIQEYTRDIPEVQEKSIKTGSYRDRDHEDPQKDDPEDDSPQPK